MDDLELDQITKALEEYINQEGYAKYYVADQRTLDMYTSVFVDSRDVDDLGTILNKLKQYHLLKGGFSVKFLFCVKYVV